MSRRNVGRGGVRVNPPWEYCPDCEVQSSKIASAGLSHSYGGAG